MRVPTRGPHVTITLEHHAVVIPRSYCGHFTLPNRDKSGSLDCGAVPELTTIVPTRGPHTAVVLQHNAVALTRSYCHHVCRHLHKVVFADCGSVPELAITVPTRGPQAAIPLQHHAVRLAQCETI